MRESTLWDPMRRQRRRTLRIDTPRRRNKLTTEPGERGVRDENKSLLLRRMNMWRPTPSSCSPARTPSSFSYSSFQNAASCTAFFRGFAPPCALLVLLRILYQPAVER